MSLRLVEVFLPQQQQESMGELLATYSLKKIWYVSLPEKQVLVKILLDEAQVEPVVDYLESEFAHKENFQLLILPIEASLPRPSSEKLESEDNSENTSSRISREEIYTKVAESISFAWTEILLVLLSTEIAAIGLVRGKEAVIIGAMVVAPLLKPNMALAIATILGDLSLAIKTLKVGFTQIFVALVFSVLLGIFFPVNLGMSEIAARTTVNFTDVILAFASGIAGAISLTIGENSAVVGVMVSVALLPPLVALGMLLGSGLWHPALGSTVLVLTNIVCLNLAAIATFWVQDIRPQQWWQKFKAEKVTGVVSIFWLLLLAALIGFIFMFEFSYG